MSCRRAWKSAPISARRQPRAQGERTAKAGKSDELGIAHGTRVKGKQTIGLDEGIGQSARARGISRNHVFHFALAFSGDV